MGANGEVPLKVKSKIIRVANAVVKISDLRAQGAELAGSEGEVEFVFVEFA